MNGKGYQMIYKGAAGKAFSAHMPAYILSIYKLTFSKKSSFSRRRESSVFNAFWIPRSSRRMTNPEFINRLYAALLLLTFVMLIVPVAGYAEDDVGIVVALKGRAEIQRENRKIEAALKGSILLQDTVQTKTASRAKMLFRDDSILTLGENSRVVIKDYLYAEGRKKGKTIFNLMDGKLRSLVGNNEFEVHTPTVVVAARGTYFITWTELEDRVPVSGVTVIEGVVEMWSINTAIKGVVKIERGMMSKGAMNKSPTPAMPAPAALMKELIEATELQGTPEAEKKPVIEERKGTGAQPGGPGASVREEAPSVRREAIPSTPPIQNQEPPRLQDTPVRIRIPIPPAETPVDIKIPIPEGL
ncbi:MAG: FecR family protein [Thermodesulfovibrionales bacterium]